MAKLIIKRTSEWVNRMRDIALYLDGEKIGVIGNGQTKEFDIDPGEHRLNSKIDWCGSETMIFNLTDSEIQVVKLSGFKSGKWLLPIALILSIIYFAFGQQLEISSSLFLVVMSPFGLYLLYHFTLGRNNYLRLIKC